MKHQSEHEHLHLLQNAWFTYLSTKTLISPWQGTNELTLDLAFYLQISHPRSNLMMVNAIIVITRSTYVDWLLLEMRQQGIYSFLAEILSYALVSVSGSAGDTV